MDHLPANNIYKKICINLCLYKYFFLLIQFMFRNNLYINVNNIHRQFIREAAKKNILLLAGPLRPNPPLEFIASFKSVPNRSETPLTTPLRSGLDKGMFCNNRIIVPVSTTAHVEI